MFGSQERVDCRDDVTVGVAGGFKEGPHAHERRGEDETRRLVPLLGGELRSGGQEHADVVGEFALAVVADARVALSKARHEDRPLEVLLTEQVDAQVGRT